MILSCQILVKEIAYLHFIYLLGELCQKCLDRFSSSITRYNFSIFFIHNGKSINLLYFVQYNCGVGKIKKGRRQNESLK